MLEDPSKLFMTLDGRVTISSGKMLIIDPCYVQDVDFDWFEQFELFIPFTPEGRELEKLEGKLMKQYHAHTEYVRKLLDAYSAGKPKPEPPNLPAFEEIRKRKEKLDEKIAQIRREWKCSPPHFIQGNGRIYFNTLVGDGLYPVSRSGEEHVVDLNRWGATPGVLGLAAVDAIKMMVSDSKGVTIDDSNSTFKGYDDAKAYGVYCELVVPNGVYKCAYTEGNEKVRITLETKEKT
ncbi:hypothetical protein HY642_02545 [Candidatus Woesearchaeota archaeon]|nr:hypothetical protein [Candidatus Woesearchaeota archaeon]